MSLRIDYRGLQKAERRSKKIKNRRNGHTRDGDSVKVIQREQEKRRAEIIKRKRKEKDDGKNSE